METIRLNDEKDDVRGPRGAERGKTLVSWVGESLVLVMYGLVALEIVLALLGARAVRPPVPIKSSA